MYGYLLHILLWEVQIDTGLLFLLTSRQKMWRKKGSTHIVAEQRVPSAFVSWRVRKNQGKCTPFSLLLKLLGIIFHAASGFGDVPAPGSLSCIVFFSALFPQGTLPCIFTPDCNQEYEVHFWGTS